MPGVAALGAVALGFAAFAGLAAAEEPELPERPQHNLFGVTGLIETPSAEMQPDGQFSFTTSYFGGYHRNTASVQFLPGIEGAFRYSILDETVGGPTNPRTLYDRSFDVKFRLMDEGPHWPAVALGLQDFLGTGIYSGEYVVATKSFLGGDLKVTGGLGWGRLAGANSIDNPFCKAAGRLCNRNDDFDEGGQVDVNSFFSGEEMGVFGGIEWKTPIEGLTFKAEYSDDDYDREEERGGFEQETQLNFGLEYRVAEGVDIGAYYMYGTEVGVRLSLSGNPFHPVSQADLEPPPKPVIPRQKVRPDAISALFGEINEVLTGEPATVSFVEAEVEDVEVTTIEGARWGTAMLPASADYACPDDVARAIDAEYGMLDAVSFRHADGTVVCTVALREPGRRAIRRTVQAATTYPTDWYQDEALRARIVEELAEAIDPERIGLFGIEIEPERVTVYIENRRFHAMPRAIGRTARAMTGIMPPSVALFEIVPVENSLPTASVAIERSTLEENVGQADAAWKTWAAARVTDARPVDWNKVEGTMGQFPRFSWGLGPTLPLNLFDPDQPFRADVALDVTGSVEFLPGLSLTGTVRKRIIGDLDEIDRGPGSELPNVRSNLAKYLREGDPGLYRLSADYVTKLDEGLYGRASVGYFEWMYAGIGGELLWKPADQSWGVGANLNYVRQRDFDILFDLRDYDVVTGHLSFYWDTGYKGLSVQVDAGRYLAKDWGGTFTLKRRFPNGWEVGGFFTLTDVPFDEFGEGSFDKGIFLTIPFNWAAPIETRGRYSTVLRPLTRDGGQQLIKPSPLYPTVIDTDTGGLRTNWGSFWQ